VPDDEYAGGVSMLLMMACVAGIVYALVAAAVGVVAFRRATRLATPCRPWLGPYTAALCAGITLAVLTLDTSSPKTVAITGARWQRADAIAMRFVASETGWGVYETTYRIDHDPWQKGTCARITTQGDHTVLYRSVGRDGRSETVHVARVGLDERPPTTTCDTRPWMPGPATIGLEARDAGGSGVASTEYRLDGGAWRAGSTIYVPAQGRHTVRYRSADRLGNVEQTRTKTFFVDHDPPVTWALNAVTVAPGGHAVIRFFVSDLAPRATVTIRIKGPGGTTACDAGSQPTNQVNAVALVCEMPCGTYSYDVMARDLASNRSRVNGSNTLRVAARLLALRAWIDNLAGMAHPHVTAFCNVTDQHGRPIRGARACFIWHYGRAERSVMAIVTGSGGGAYSSRLLPRSAASRRVTIRIVVSWQGQRKTAILRWPG